MEPLRSLLFVPGNRADMLIKAIAMPADAIVPDLEDSVPLTEKPNARMVTAETLPVLAEHGKRIVVRVNALDSGFLEADLEAVVGSFIYALNIPKVDSSRIVQEVDKLVTRAEHKAGIPNGQIHIIPFIETAKGVVNAYEICSASPRIIAAAFGAEDLTVDMEIRRTSEGEEVLYARSAVAVGARAAGVLALDTPYLDFRDHEAMQRDAEKGAKIGYKGKFAIHPSQLDFINQLYLPSVEDLEYAKKVVEIFREAEKQGRGAIALDGKVIDVPIAKRAQNLLAIARTIWPDSGW
jgi:citrate lyase subunit beta/citryl-CoA lyase